MSRTVAEARSWLAGQRWLSPDLDIKGLTDIAAAAISAVEADLEDMSDGRVIAGKAEAEKAREKLADTVLMRRRGRWGMLEP